MNLTTEQINKLNTAGFKLFSDKDNCASFYAKVESDDLDNIKTYLSPNHFTPNMDRFLFIAQTNKESYYLTSDIRGVYRGYRCKNSYESIWILQ